MKVGIHVALYSDIYINTQFKNTLTDYTKSDILTKVSVLLPVEWVKDGLLFKKRLHMMNKFTGYS